MCILVANKNKCFKYLGSLLSQIISNGMQSKSWQVLSRVLSLYSMEIFKILRGFVLGLIESMSFVTRIQLANLFNVNYFFVYVSEYGCDYDRQALPWLRHSIHTKHLLYGVNSILLAFRQVFWLLYYSSSSNHRHPIFIRGYNRQSKTLGSKRACERGYW